MDTQSKQTFNPVGYPPEDNHGVRYMSWGIFTVACDDQDHSILSLSAYQEPFGAFSRLQRDLWEMTPWYCLEYYLCTGWMTISPALLTYFGYLVLQDIDTAVRNAGLDYEILRRVQTLALMWLLCGILSHWSLTILQYESRVKLGPHLRAKFLPKLVKGSLLRDTGALNVDSVNFPNSYDYGDFIPGWTSFHEVFTRLRHIFTIVVEILLVLYLKSQLNDTQSNLYFLAIIVFLAIKFLSPISAAGGKGYTFWTKNQHYNRLMALFHMTFDPQYRSLIKDGQTENLYNEYEQVSNALGAVQADTYMLGWSLYPSWVWGTIRFCITNSAMALVALMLPWLSPESPLVLIMVTQHAISSVDDDVEYLRTSSDYFLGLMNEFRNYYALFDEVDAVVNSPGTETSTHLRSKGMELSLKNVSQQNVEDISLSISSGQLILITGDKESGKSTLAQILCGLVSPIRGEILVNGASLTLHANAKDVLDKTVFIGRSDTIYPVSLEENITMAVYNRDTVSVKDIDDALRQGGAFGIVETIGRQTIISPCSAPAYSTIGTIGPGAQRALQENSPDPIPVEFSRANRQHIIASRAFLRLMVCEIGLIILDEATSDMNPLQEREVIENFCRLARNQGKTLIIVATHNLFTVAKHADLIIRMENGKIAEQGCHDELIEGRGGYRSLYEYATGGKELF